jgi:cell division protein YceG involved in septum cleavage
MARFFRRVIIWSFACALLLIAVLVFQLLRFQHGAIPMGSQPAVFLIRSGSNIKSIAQELALQKIIDDPWLFIVVAMVTGLEPGVRAV